MTDTTATDFITIGPKFLTLAQHLESTQRHPVLIFGSSSSGKTSLLISLIQCLQTSGAVDVSLGRPIFDAADPRSAPRHRSAELIYGLDSYKVDAGGRLASTQVDEPFFIPIDVQPRNSERPAVKLALLEGRGEGYEPNAADGQDFFRAFSPEIKQLLETFSYGITVIYVAPYSNGSGHERDTTQSNFGLLGALDGYRTARAMRNCDFHMFLLTKWDQYAPPMNGSRLFENPWPTDVEHVLRDRYDRAWGKFQSLPLEGDARERRAFMQYTAGHFVDGRRSRPPELFASTYDRYSRTLVNWIYGNATQLAISGQQFSIGLRGVLFDDVVGDEITKITLSQRAASLLLSGSVRRPW